MKYSDFRLQKRNSLVFLLLWSCSIVQTVPALQGSVADRRELRSHVTRAFVVDDRLSVLRRLPDLKSTVVRRLHLGRKVWIVAARPKRNDQPVFYRVAVSRRTAGWIHASALTIPRRRGEDARLMRLISDLRDPFDRIVLYRLMIEYFTRSPLLPRALLQLGTEAEAAAAMLTKRSSHRLAKLDTEKSEANPRDYFLSDSGLDRYSRIGITFDFDTEAGEYFYDGKAYREIISRYPNSDMAKEARARLVSIEKGGRRRP